jgi:hypothetical protein
MRYLGTFLESNYRNDIKERFKVRNRDVILIFNEVALDRITHILIYRDYDETCEGKVYYDVLEVNFGISLQTYINDRGNRYNPVYGQLYQTISDYIDYRLELLRNNRLHELAPGREIDLTRENL